MSILTSCGAGDRLFGETRDEQPLRVVDSRTLGEGIAFLTYERPLPAS